MQGHQESRGSLATDKTEEENQLRTNSKHQPIDQSFRDYQALSSSNKQCPFCKSKDSIKRQLSILKEAVQAKNKKIYELEQFIHRLSHMVLTDSNAPLSVNEYQSQNQHQKNSKQTFDKGASSFSSGAAAMTNSQADQSQQRVLKQISKQNSVSGHLSRINSELTAFEEEHVKLEIRKQIQNMNISNGRESVWSEKNESKQSRLKKKAIAIMSVLPGGLRSTELHEFSSMSEPLNEDQPGAINSRVLYPKIPKPSSFLKKNQNSSSMTGKPNSSFCYKSKSSENQCI